MNTSLQCAEESWREISGLLAAQVHKGHRLFQYINSSSSSAMHASELPRRRRQEPLLIAYPSIRPRLPSLPTPEMQRASIMQY